MKQKMVWFVFEKRTAIISDEENRRKMQMEEKNVQFERMGRDYQYLGQMEDLYLHAFPDSERKPFSMILDGEESGKMEAFAVTVNGQPAALAFVILGETMHVLDYLAVDPGMRSMGLGAIILGWLKNRYDRPFIVEIESTKSGDEQAIRRKKFYQRAGMIEGDFEFTLFGVPMEMMSSQGKPDFARYFAVMQAYFDFDASGHIVLLQDKKKTDQQ